MAYAYSAVEVTLLKSKLLAADIPYYTRNEYTNEVIGVGMFGGYNAAVGPVEFWVQAPSLSEAKRLTSPKNPDVPAVPLASCPACGTPNIHHLAQCLDCGLQLT